MKRFIGELKIEDLDLANDIIKALEGQPVSGREYEIEMYERIHDPMRNGYSIDVLLKIFEVVE